MGKTLRTMLAGCGGMSNAWLRVASEIPEIEIVGLMDIKLEAAQERAERHELTDVKIGTDLTGMLDELKPDVVFDCSIPEAHVTITLEALKHGCHVMGEKPLADSMENARKMVAAAQEAGKIYSVIQNRRYNASMRRLRAWLDTGVLGALTTLDSDFYIGAHFGGFRDRMEHVLLLDMAIHSFDQARMISGADPVKVYCREWNPAGSWYDHQASAIAIFEMTGGLVYTYRGSWCAEGLNTSWDCDWRVIGTEGSATWDGAEAFHAQVVCERGEFFSKHEDVEVPEASADARVGGHGGLIREFVDCVLNGGTPETVCTDNIKSLAMVFGAIQSAQEGREIEIEV
ncbi:Gfo/Idh/MocA family oxidoreductase [bacterium]|nr:Gfo/Idh/MocA family oxidoreductase [bacterium]